MQIENKHLRLGLLPSAILLVKGLEVQMAREFYVVRGTVTLRPGQVISTTSFPHSTSCRLEFYCLDLTTSLVPRRYGTGGIKVGGSDRVVTMVSASYHCHSNCYPARALSRCH